MNTLEILAPYCLIEADGSPENASILTFVHGESQTTIRIIFNDISGAEIAITHMTTLPYRHTGKGYGTEALHTLIGCALRQGVRDIRAIQVQTRSENFWRKNGFIALNNPTNDYQYSLRGGAT